MMDIIFTEFQKGMKQKLFIYVINEPAYQFMSLVERGLVGAHILINQIIESLQSNALSTLGGDREMHSQNLEELDNLYQQNQLQQIPVSNSNSLEEEKVPLELFDQPKQESYMNEQFYQELKDNDFAFIQSKQDLSTLLNKNWQTHIYEEDFQGIHASTLVYGIFFKQNDSGRVFHQHLANFNKNAKDEIKDIELKIEPFLDGSLNLDDVLIHQDQALKSFYKGELGVGMGRATKQRKIQIKTSFHKAILLLYKACTTTESQTFHLISPRHIVMLGRLQTEKNFYGEHFYIDVFYNFEEDLKFGEPVTKIQVHTELVFVKNTPLIVKKVKEYYEKNVVKGFNQNLKPAIQKWIQEEIIHNQLYLKQSSQQNQGQRKATSAQKGQSQISQQKQLLTPEELSTNFILSLREQTSAFNMPDEELEFIINARLQEARESILADLAQNKIRVDSKNKMISPDQENCHIF